LILGEGKSHLLLVENRLEEFEQKLSSYFLFYFEKLLPARPVVHKLSTHIAVFPTMGTFLVIAEVISVVDSARTSKGVGTKLIIRQNIFYLIVYFL
jgi:hypothetical protein